jgi:hypothetical protein
VIGFPKEWVTRVGQYGGNGGDSLGTGWGDSGYNSENSLVGGGVGQNLDGSIKFYKIF